MNDMRSHSRTLAPVRELGPKTGEIVSTPPRQRPDGGTTNPLFENSRPASERRPKSRSAAAKKKARETTKKNTAENGRGNDREAGQDNGETPAAATNGEPDPAAEEAVSGDRLNFQVSRDLRAMPVGVAEVADGTDVEDEFDDYDYDDEVDEAADGEQRAQARRSKRGKGPSSRPKRRREVADETSSEEDKFPWHYQFDDDEPEELQAKSRLLSRAFRSSVG